MPEQTSRRDELSSKLRALKAIQPQNDPYQGPGAVVLSDLIERYVNDFELITPFQKKNLKPACYKLTVGDECTVGGNIQPLQDIPGRNTIEIEPFQVAVIKTQEIINMPPFLIGRWNIQVSRAYDGLLWVGGPQVDAGYVGHLFCPIYNLSNRRVTLKLGDSFAVIDFVRTTPFVKDLSKPYQSKPYGDLPERILFEDYNPENLQSALAAQLTQMQEDIRKTDKDTRSRADKLEERMNNFISVTLGAIGILFAVLALFVTVGRPAALPLWAFLSVFFSFLAFILAITAFKWRH